MLIKLLDHLKKIEVLKRQYIGIVVDNVDPKQLGRVKCTIAGVLEGDANILPWVFPKNPPGQGGTGTSSAVECPEIGAQLIIEFPFDDVYSPFYTGFWQSSETHQGEFNEDYPNTRGWVDSDGTYYKVNQAKRIADFYHASGSRVRHNKDGSIDIISPKGINLMSQDGLCAVRIDTIAGDVRFQNRGIGELTGAKTKISGKNHEVSVGSVVDNATGGREQITGGGYKHVVAGGFSESIVSNRALSVGGDENIVVAGKTETIVGMGRNEVFALGNDEKTLTAGNRETTIVLGNYKITLTAGNYDVDIVAGDAKIHTAAGSTEISTSAGKMTISPTGDIEVSNSLAKMTMAVDGTVEMTDGTIAKLKLAQGMVGLGTSACEIVDMLIKTIDAILPANQTALCMTSTGPSGPLLPPATVALTAYKALLTAIKGGV